LPIDPVARRGTDLTLHQPAPVRNGSVCATVQCATVSGTVGVVRAARGSAAPVYKERTTESSHLTCRRRRDPIDHQNNGDVSGRTSREG